MTVLRLFAVALGAVLVYSLYLPSAHPPARFLAEVRREHDLNVAFWGADGGGEILARALSLYEGRDALTPAAFAPAPSIPVTATNAAVAQQMTDILQRLLHNGYAQGFDALVLLATYRLSALAQWLPWLAGFALLACFDGYLARLVGRKEFLDPNPARFALCATGALLVLALLPLLLIVPAVIEPCMLGGTGLLAGLLTARAVRHLQG
jgi:hypothetical protein